MSPVAGASREAQLDKGVTGRRRVGNCKLSRICLLGSLLPLLLVLLGCGNGAAVGSSGGAGEVEGEVGFAVTEMDPTAVPIVIIGGGLAGLAAAAEILSEGGSVVILEKTPRLGGNSAKASSGMSAAGSDPQLAEGIDDGPALLLEDTIRSGQGLSSEELVEVFVKEGAGAIRFLQNLGVNLSSIQQLGGHSRPRTHRAAPDGKPTNIGYRIMLALIAHLQGLEKAEPKRVRILVRSKALELLTEPILPALGDFPSQGKNGEGGRRVVGVRVVTSFPDPKDGETYENVLGSSVILATGGYSADTEGLIAQHAPCLRQLATTNGPFATGDGVRLGSAVGAALVHMDQVQVHPTGLVDPSDPTSGTKILGPEVLRGSGGILLNHEGKRFVNELDTRDKVVSAMLRSCSPLDSAPGSSPPCSTEDPGQCCPVPAVVAHLVLTQEALDAFGEAPARFYLAKGLMKKFNSLEDLCTGLGLPLQEVAATIAAYEAAAEQAAGGKGAPDAFGKTLFPSRFSAHVGPKAGGGAGEPLYAALVTPVLHYCMGGLAFDERGRVLQAPLAQEEGQAQHAIPGLLAAGEVTGGLHGANRLAGNSLLECVVFGRRAAGTALVDAEEQQDLMSAQEWMNVVSAPQARQDLMTGDEWADFVASRTARKGKKAGAAAHEEL